MKKATFFDVVSAIKNHRPLMWRGDTQVFPLGIELESGCGRKWNVKCDQGRIIFWDEDSNDFARHFYIY